MFKHQLIAETVSSRNDDAPIASLNPPDAVRRLLEQHTGFRQFRVVLPGTLTWASATQGMRGRTTLTAATTLLDMVMAYVPEDRGRIVDAIAAAIGEARGFHFSARIEADGAARVIETIGGAKTSNGRVSELFGLARDVTGTLEREAMAASRARLIRHLVEDMPVPVVVLDRALRVVACSAEWARAYGLPFRSAALNEPLGKLVDLSCEATAAIIEARNGRTVHLGLWFHSGEQRRKIRRNCVVMPWPCGSEAVGGVLMVIGGGEPSYASREIADQVLGRTMQGLRGMLETPPPASH